MQGGGRACAQRVLVNIVEGKMFAEFRSDSRETLEAWIKAEGMHYDWLVRIEWEMRDGKLQIAGCCRPNARDWQTFLNGGRNEARNLQLNLGRMQQRIVNQTVMHGVF